MGKLKRGPKSQAYAFLQRMLGQGLIEQHTQEDGTIRYSMTDKGREEADKFREAA
jgi:DNA-binding PadR family transcriptional regulator